MHVITAITLEPKNFDAFGDFPSAAELREYADNTELLGSSYVSSTYHGHGAFTTIADALRHMHEFITANHANEPDASCEIAFPISPSFYCYIAAEPLPSLFAE
jgi:hypothetical protein